MILKSTRSYMNIVVKPIRRSFPHKVAKRQAITQCTMYMADIHEPPRKRVSPGKSKKNDNNSKSVQNHRIQSQFDAENIKSQGAHLWHFREVKKVQVEESCGLLVDNLEFQFEQNFPQLNPNQCLS